MIDKVELINKITHKIQKLNQYNLELVLYLLDNIVGIYKEFNKSFIILQLAEIYKEKKEQLNNMLIV